VEFFAQWRQSLGPVHEHQLPSHQPERQLRSSLRILGQVS